MSLDARVGSRRLLLAWANQSGYRTLREELTARESMLIWLVPFAAWMVFGGWILLVPVGWVGGACLRAWIRRSLPGAGEMGKGSSGTESLGGPGSSRLGSREEPR